MAVLIGQASINENGGISGGKVGDQTGREIYTGNWYPYSWNVMLVCTDKDLAKRAADYMKAICADDDFGYDQPTRGTGHANIIASGGDVNNAKSGSYDCSSLVSSCYKLAGLNISSWCTTRNLREALLATGKFVAYTDADHVNSDAYAEIGALYLREGYHVIMALQNGSKVEPPKPAQSEAPVPTPVQPSKPTYIVGNVYTLQVELRVRTGAGTNNPAKTHNQLTADGQKHDADWDGALDPGTKVTCKEVKNVGDDIWIKAPSGWMAAYYQGELYIK